jgi:hypothetical protein
MPKVSFEKSFSLTPTHSLVVGERSFEVPPLTLERFLSLMGTDFSALKTELVKGALAQVGDTGSAELPSLGMLKNLIADAKAAGEEIALRETVERDFPGLVHDLARMLHALPPAAVAPLVLAVVPGLDPEAWKAHGTPIKALDLFRFFCGAHDWTFISETIGYGKPKDKDEQPTTKATVSGALLSFCRAHPFYSPEQLLDMRVEGFFHLRAGATEAFEKAEAASDVSAGSTLSEEELIRASGAPVRKASSELLASIEAADRDAGLVD